MANGWILSANSVLGITTNDSAGVKAPDYFNLDLTAGRALGKTPWGEWGLGFVGFGAWDLQNTALSRQFGGPAEAIGGGGVFGTNFGNVNLTIILSHQFVTYGFTNAGKNDNRVWTSIALPLWTPSTKQQPLQGVLSPIQHF